MLPSIQTAGRASSGLRPMVSSGMSRPSALLPIEITRATSGMFLRPGGELVRELGVVEVFLAKHSGSWVGVRGRYYAADTATGTDDARYATTCLSRRAMRWAAAATLSALGALASPAIAADPAKTLHVALTSAEMSFDPQFSADAGTDGIIDHIFDAMLDYDYLVRPVKLVPRTLVAMPSVEDGGASYVFRFRHGIHFTPDPAFNGKPRELTAGDQAYALKRLLDPAVKSPWLWLVDGKVVGASEARAKALQIRKIRLRRSDSRHRGRRPLHAAASPQASDLRFLYAFAIPNTAPVAREVVEAYGSDIGAHPVGTGPYVLGKYRRSSKIELLANPGYRDFVYDPQGRCRLNPHRSRRRSRAESFRSPAGSRSRSSRRGRPCGSPSSSASSTCSISFP